MGAPLPQVTRHSLLPFLDNTAQSTTGMGRSSQCVGRLLGDDQCSDCLLAAPEKSGTANPIDPWQVEWSWVCFSAFIIAGFVFCFLGYAKFS